MFTSLVRTELLKLRTVRGPALLGSAAVLITGFLALQSVSSAGRGATASIGTVGLQQGLLQTAGRGQLVVLSIGVLIATGERRHGVLTLTLLQAPRRLTVLAAQAVAAAITGLGLALSTLAVAVLAGLGSGALHSPRPDAAIAAAAAGQVAVYPVYALLGLGVGTLLGGSPPIALLVPLAWFLLLEGFAGSLATGLAPWLPGRLACALAGNGDLPALLPVAVAGVVLPAYALLLAAAAAATSSRLDVA
jgi:ABC-2 type transport system permease protein